MKSKNRKKMILGAASYERQMKIDMIFAITFLFVVAACILNIFL